MKIIATIPPPIGEMPYIVGYHPMVSAARFNVGSCKRSPYSPEETLTMLSRVLGKKPLYVDIKGRQLRIARWASQNFGEIILNHEIEVDLPATIYFRGDEENPSIIHKINGNRVYVEPRPKHVIGEGQSVNVIGANLKIKGYLTRDDIRYIDAARKLGIINIMASYVESGDDLEEILSLYPEARITAKIESVKGMYFIADDYEQYKITTTLMAAREDLYNEMIQGNISVLKLLGKIVKVDPNAIVASRLVESFLDKIYISLPDLSDVCLMDAIGYKNFLLSDDLCERKEPFLRAMEFFERYFKERADFI